MSWTLLMKAIANDGAVEEYALDRYREKRDANKEEWEDFVARRLERVTRPS